MVEWSWGALDFPSGVTLYSPLGATSVENTPESPLSPCLFLLCAQQASPVSTYAAYVCTVGNGRWIWRSLGAGPDWWPGGGALAVTAVQTTLPGVALDPYLFILDRDNIAWVCSWQSSGWQWTQLGFPPVHNRRVGIAAGIGAVAVAGPPPAPQLPYVFVQGNDGDLWLNCWDGTSWGWTDLGNPGVGPGMLPVGVLTVRDSPQQEQRPYVFVLADDGNLWQDWWNGTAWGWVNQGTPPGVGLARSVGVIATTTEAPLATGPFAVLIGTDGDLWCNGWNGTSWQWTGLGSPPGVTLGAGLGIVAVDIKDQLVPAAFLTGDDGNVWYCWWDGMGNSGWINQGSPGGVSVVSAAGVSVARDQPQAPTRPYVFVVGNDQGLYYNSVQA